MRIVVKVGTQIIVGKGGLNQKRIASLVDEISMLLRAGHQVILVSSGAIGTGLPLLHFSSPLQKKVAAAIGQPTLIHHYIKEAHKRKILVGQILLLSEDLLNKKHFKNLMANIEEMLAHKVVPIINENDIMKTQDLRVGDNDTLSSIVAVGLKADKLIILTNQDGLYTCNPDHDKEARLVKEVAKTTSKIENLCKEGKSDLGVGGMLIKVKAAKYATARGVETLIGNGAKKGTILSALGKDFTGTRFLAKK